MSTRDAILAAVRLARPAFVSLPDMTVLRQFNQLTDENALRTQFIRAARSGGSTVAEIARDEIASTIAALHPHAEHLLSSVDEMLGNVPFPNDATAFANVDLFVCNADLGVAQDGSVWIPDTRVEHRAALFLAEHVVVLLDDSALVATLHQAYEKIDVSTNAFGIFISGPSKTADIEQSLVIGAHGPISFTLLLVA